MKKSIIVVAMLLAVFGAVPAFAAGPTCTVPGDYATIQGAVNDSACTTINVAAGVYNENVVIGHTLTLNGARAGIDARTRSGSESIINGSSAANITVTASNVIVDGFKLLGPINQGSAAIVMMGGNLGETIKNNIIENPGRAASFNTSNTLFQKNVVNNSATSGDGFQANSSPVHDVTISDNNFGGANGAIYNADITIIEGNLNVVVSGNSSNGDGTLVALFKTNGAQVTSNTVVGDNNSSAVYIGGGDSNITVTGNKISSAKSAVKVANAFGVGKNYSVTVFKNFLQNNAYGLNVQLNSITDTVVAHRNRITGNTIYGVFNDLVSGGLTNATCNWWGASDGPGPVGPGSGDKVTSNVTFNPWLTSPNLNDQCTEGDNNNNNQDNNDKNGHQDQ